LTEITRDIFRVLSRCLAAQFWACGVCAWYDVHCTHTAGSKLRCQTPTKHTKNITGNFSQARSALPDDGSQTIRNTSEW